MKKHITIFLLFLPLFNFSQQLDYIVLHQSDTIYGKYVKGMNDYINNYIRLRTDTGKIKIPTKDVKEIYWNKRKYWVYIDSCEGGWEKYEVVIEGIVSFLYLKGNYNGYCEDMVVINNDIYPIKEYHLSDLVWNFLAKCSAFEEKYIDYYIQYANQKSLLRTRTKVYKWLEMISYYNTHCGIIN